MKRNEFVTEWCLLQNQFDSYEKHSLYIKLVSILVLLIAEISGITSVSIVFILMVLWLQDGIWKTFQSRIEPRLFQLESYLSDESDKSTCQFNTEYNKVRLNGLALIIEYAYQSIRPTVAFPHLILILILLMELIF